MSQQITQIEEVSSVASSLQSDRDFGTTTSGWRNNKVHFQPDIDYCGLDKIDKFIHIHHITLEHFWKSEKQFFSYEDIRDMCDKVGLSLSQEDEVSLKCNLFKNNLAVSIGDFKGMIRSWRGVPMTKVNDLLQKRSEVLGETMMAKNGNRSEKRLSRPQSSVTFNRTRPQSSTENKSIQYIKLQKARQKEQENKLVQAINKAKNQEEYQVLIKMGEANDLNKQMQSLLTFRAYKNAQGNLRVRVFNLDKFEKEINLDEFQREFNSIKKKYNQSKNFKVWEMLASLTSSKKGVLQPPGHQTTSLAKKNIKTIDREKKKRKLVDILSETINLTNVFKEQLRILKAQGICIRNV